MTDSDRLTRRMTRARNAFIALGKHRGNTKEAAADQGIAETTLRKRVADYCDANGYLTPFEAAWRYQQGQETEQIGIFSGDGA